MNSMPEDATAAIRAGWRQGVRRTCIYFDHENHLKSLVVVFAARVTALYRHLRVSQVGSLC